MMSRWWILVEAVAAALGAEERETVLGDLTECGETAGFALLDVLGLVIRRQAMFWKSWRPWVAGFGITVPFSLFLMGLSVSVSVACRSLIDPERLSATGPAFSWPLLMLACHVFLLAAWSWTAGFVVGSISRPTLWLNAVLCSFPCLFCLARFHTPSLSRFCLFLFLVPALWGARWGWRSLRTRWSTAIVLALSTTLILVLVECLRGPHGLSPFALVTDVFLSWPAWHIATLAGRPTRQAC